MQEILYKDYAYLYDLLYSCSKYFEIADKTRKIFDLYGCRVKSVLDVACGTGRLLSLLSDQDVSISGIDKHIRMIEIARRTNPSGSFMLGHMQALPTTEKFDAVLCVSAINYNRSTMELFSTLSGMYRALAEGGICILFNPLVVGGRTKINRLHCNSAMTNGVKAVKIGTWVKLPYCNTCMAFFFIFTRKCGRFRVGIDVHWLRIYEVQEITTLMQSVGFNVSVHDFHTLKPHVSQKGMPVIVGVKS